MITVVQRVERATVEVGGRIVGAIERGLAVLVGVHGTDSPFDVRYTAEKLAGLRVLADEQGKMNLSVPSAGGGFLLVPNFTLCAETARGNRPSFTPAMAPDRAAEMFEQVCTQLASAAGTARGSPVAVERGVFGADMRVTIINDGPVTLVLDSAPARPRQP
ncbi:MAG: D-aminoacyl-tRNA deacylase [Phycisphaerales bacterium]